MADLPVLDRFVLALIAAGVSTPYGMQREAGLSLGATTPSLARLLKAKLVQRDKQSVGRRKRHVYGLTSAGRKAAQDSDILESGENARRDLDTILRVVHLALTQDATAKALRRFVAEAIEFRRREFETCAAGNRGPASTRELFYVAKRRIWDQQRLKAEIDFLSGLASELPTRRTNKGIPSGEVPPLLPYLTE